ncbi:hypothetical protein B0T26DRAFT_747650 [Lasiosphaeria miniovina]|uniref:Uncharacterized protein n=1 Tax=Lasiosphaeria miniovina TaxID=1954250 RepID=A0AA40B4F9_9PEZI|nr:uncharacterized protein B0T26DRAFT_747650 [Lasiosphaeria miniovina]KAK0727307.1 hypothetical protein B0T26DRAFT_747650 [Lasiosphaeria miniovina]
MADHQISADAPSTPAFLHLGDLEKATILDPGLDHKVPSTPPAQQHTDSDSKMASRRRMLLAIGLCLLLLLDQIAATEVEHFSLSALLESASPEALHELLQKYFPQRFRPGVWLSEQEAIEAVHRADAALAASLLQLAKPNFTVNFGADHKSKHNHRWALSKLVPRDNNSEQHTEPHVVYNTFGKLKHVKHLEHFLIFPFGDFVNIKIQLIYRNHVVDIV